MKKIILALSTSIVLLSGLNTSEASENVTSKACKEFKLNDCTHLNAYLFKSLDRKLLQDLTYYDTFEVSTKPLKKNAYYYVIYNHDTPLKAYRIITKSKKQKQLLNYSYQYIKAEQKRNNYDPMKEYSNYKMEFNNNFKEYASIK